MQRPGSGLLQQQQRDGRVARQRLHQQQEAAAAHARELLQGSAGVARSGLSHPLYMPLYEESTLQDVLQQQQIVSGGRYSSRATYDQTADGRLLEDILNMCPLLTPAATLVETKLSNRALRLDTIRSAGESAAAAGAAPANVSSSSSSAEATGRQARRRPLKLSRTKAKKSGLFDVRSDFDGPGSSRRATVHAAAPAAAATTASPRTSAAGAFHRSGTSPEAAAAVSTETGALPVAPIPVATSSTVAGIGTVPSADIPVAAGARVCCGGVGRKLRYEDMEQLFAMWLHYVRRVCGAAESAAPPSESTGKWSGSGASGPQQHQQQHQKHATRQQQGFERLHQQQESNEQPRKAADRCMALSKAAWQGARVRVTRSTTPTLVGLEGVVVEETQHSLLLLCPDERLRRLLKHTVTLKAQTLDGSNFFLHPQHLQHSSAARSKVKFKPKSSLLL